MYINDIHNIILLLNYISGLSDWLAQCTCSGIHVKNGGLHADKRQTSRILCTWWALWEWLPLYSTVVSFVAASTCLHLQAIQVFCTLSCSLPSVCGVLLLCFWTHFEVLFIMFVVRFPLLFIWVLFIEYGGNESTYRTAGAWCWIRNWKIIALKINL